MRAPKSDKSVLQLCPWDVLSEPLLLQRVRSAGRQENEPWVPAARRVHLGKEYRHQFGDRCGRYLRKLDFQPELVRHEVDSRPFRLQRRAYVRFERHLGRTLAKIAFRVCAVAARWLGTGPNSFSQ